MKYRLDSKLVNNNHHIDFSPLSKFPGFLSAESWIYIIAYFHCSSYFEYNLMWILKVNDPPDSNFIEDTSINVRRGLIFKNGGAIWSSWDACAKQFIIKTWGNRGNVVILKLAENANSSQIKYNVWCIEPELYSTKRVFIQKVGILKRNWQNVLSFIKVL